MYEESMHLMLISSNKLSLRVRIIFFCEGMNRAAIYLH